MQNCHVILKVQFLNLQKLNLQKLNLQKLRNVFLIQNACCEKNKMIFFTLSTIFSLGIFNACSIVTCLGLFIRPAVRGHAVQPALHWVQAVRSIRYLFFVSVTALKAQASLHKPHLMQAL